MKKDLLKSPVAALLITSLFLIGCQPPSSSDKSARKLTPLDDSGTNKQGTVTDKVCSKALLDLYRELQKTQKQSHSLAQDEELSKDSEGLQKELARNRRTQIDLCQSVKDQFRSESIDSCFINSEVKTEDTTLSTSKIQAECTEAENDLKKMKRPPQGSEQEDSNSEPKTESQIHTDSSESSTKNSMSAEVNVGEIEFTKESLELVQLKSPQQRKFISEGRVHIGVETLRSELVDKKVACLFTTLSKEVPQETTYQFVSVNNDKKSDAAGLAFKGLTTNLFFQSKETVISMFCMNLDLSLENNKVTALQKVFGDLVKVKAKNSATSRSEERLNKDVPPTPEKKAVSASDSQQATSTGVDETQTGNSPQGSKQMEEMKTMAEKLKTEITQARDNSLAKIEETSARMVKQVETAGTNLIKQSEASGENLIKLSEKAGLNLTERAGTTLKEVSTHAAAQAKEVGTHTAKAFEKSAVVVVKEAEKAVDQSMEKAKVKAKETAKEIVNENIPNPVKAVTEPVKKGYSSVKSYFSARTAELGVFWNRLTTSDPHGLKEKKK